MKSFRRLGLASLVAAAMVLPATASAQTSSPSDAVDLMKSGIALAREGKLPEAREKLRAAFAAKRSYDVAANLGFVEAELGAWKDAATHLDYAARLFPPSAEPEIGTRIHDYLTDVRTHVAALQIDADADASVSVDGERIGRTPLEAPLFLEPGAHVLLLQKDGFEDLSENVEAKAGTSTARQLRMVKREGPTGVEPTERPLWPALVIGGVGVAGLGVGIAGFVLRAGARSDADSLHDSLTTSGKACASPCPIDDKLGDANTFLGLGIAGVSVAGAATIGTVIYLLLPNEPAETSSAVRIVPVLGDSFGLSVKGTF